MATENLRKNEMMNHLLEALERGEDIGHYGRLVFAIVGRHFVDENELVQTLARDPGFDEAQAKVLVHDVIERDYSPPGRAKILEYQTKQDFPITPNPDDPDAANVYRDLEFPEHVYEHIAEYRQEKVESQNS
jgi:hypothetical protein